MPKRNIIVIKDRELKIVKLLNLDFNVLNTKIIINKKYGANTMNKPMMPKA
jgi:hypothetical protein